MIDYFLSGFDGCCLNCPEEERRVICGDAIWCDRCLCLKGCEYYVAGSGSRKGYCSIRKQLLDELKSDYDVNPKELLSRLKQIKSQGIRVPKAVREIVDRVQQPKLF